ncbi:MAG: BtpA/SgcQ family protein [Myxococcales bacterium]|nr:BtpA/SgcQ family protein [Myxococcales bacterium]
MAVPHGVIGAVHLRPMPGDPRYAGGGFDAVERAALADAEALVDGGVDGLIVENFGSAPYPRGDARQRTAPEQVAAMAIVVRELVRRFAVPVGVNCLRNDVMSALGVAAAAGAAFVRSNLHVGVYLTDQGLLEGEAFDTLRYRRAIGAEGVAILADVLVKHGAPLVPTTPAAATEECFSRGLADAVVVSGVATGAAVDPDVLSEARRAAGARPVFIGSGFRPETVAPLASMANGAIVGTWLKCDGEVDRPVDPARVRALSARARGRFFPSGSVPDVP